MPWACLEGAPRGPNESLREGKVSDEEEGGGGRGDVMGIVKGRMMTKVGTVMTMVVWAARA